MQVLKHLSGIEAAKAAAHGALKALRGFAAAFKVSVASISIEVDPEPGTADSGNLEHDLVDLFDRVGRAAKAANKAWVLLIDEVQYLSSSDLSALIVALHAINRSNLPVLMFGAGLPQIAAMSGDAKSYAERLFLFRRIDALDETAASEAIRQPIQEEDGRIDDDALAHIFQQTRGYPYFLQEWGFQIWNLAETWPFTLQDARNASHAALQRMDEFFFRVRFDRLTPKERDYVLAMAGLGSGPYRSGEVAHALGETPQTLGPRRAAIIRKGMVYSPEHGDVDFTVPMFDDYLRRIYIDQN